MTQNVLLTSLLLIQCCSSLVMYKNKDYYRNTSGLKTIYPCPVSNLQTDSTVDDFIRKASSMAPEEVVDTIMKYFNEQYAEITRKYIRKKKAELCDTGAYVALSGMPESPRKTFLIGNNNNDSPVHVSYPPGSLLESSGISCDIALFISELKMFAIKEDATIPFVMAGVTGAAVLTASIPYLEIGIRGKYLLVDYRTDKVVCAGEFREKFESCYLGNRENLRNTAYTVLTKILYKTPYWNIPNFYRKSKDLTKSYH